MIYKKNNKVIPVFSPVNGVIKELKDVKDEVFSQETIGKGCAIIPEDSYIYSPIKGKVITAFPTGHAYGIKHKTGPSILIHIGLDTVELEGKGFLKLVVTNSKVTPKSKLTRVDWKIIEEAKKIKDVIIIATDDSMEGFEIKQNFKAGEKINKGDLLFTIVKSK